jgi:hypothetical protein
MLPPMKIRCPADDGTADHLAFDVRMPLIVSGTLPLLRLRCPCGKGLVVDARPETQGVGGAA